MTEPPSHTGIPLSATVEEHEDLTVLHLAGDIMGSVAPALRTLVQKSGESVHLVFDCEELGKINSYGAAAWGALVASAAARCEFAFCPTAFVDFAAVIPEIIGAGRITSFYAPYRCVQPACDGAVQRLFASAGTLAGEGLGTVPCPECGKPCNPEVELADYKAVLQPK